MKHLLIPVLGYPEILTDSDLSKIMISVFGSNDVSYSTFDTVTNYVHLANQKSNLYPVNNLATYLKRMYTHNYSINNVVRGDILAYTSVSDTYTILPYFVDQVLHYHVTIPQFQEKNKLFTYL